MSQQDGLVGKGAKPEDLILIPRTHIVEGDNELPQLSPDFYTHVHTHTHTQRD